jgi:hypothetical protein
MGWVIAQFEWLFWRNSVGGWMVDKVVGYQCHVASRESKEHII